MPMITSKITIPVITINDKTIYDKTTITTPTTITTVETWPQRSMSVVNVLGVVIVVLSLIVKVVLDPNSFAK